MLGDLRFLTFSFLQNKSHQLTKYISYFCTSKKTNSQFSMKSGLLKIKNTSKYEMIPYTYTIYFNLQKEKSTASGILNVIPNYKVIAPKDFPYIYDKLLQSCPTLCDPMDHSWFRYPWDSPGENTGMGCHSFSRCSSWPRDQTHVSYILCIDRWCLQHQCHLGSPIYIFTYILLFLHSSSKL